MLMTSDWDWLTDVDEAPVTGVPLADVQLGYEAGDWATIATLARAARVSVQTVLDVYELAGGLKWEVNYGWGVDGTGGYAGTRHGVRTRDAGEIRDAGKAYIQLADDFDSTVEAIVELASGVVGEQASRPRKAVSDDLVTAAGQRGIRVRTLARLEAQGHSRDDIKRHLRDAMMASPHVSRDEAVQAYWA